MYIYNLQIIGLVGCTICYIDFVKEIIIGAELLGTLELKDAKCDNNSKIIPGRGRK